MEVVCRKVAIGRIVCKNHRLDISKTASFSLAGSLGGHLELLKAWRARNQVPGKAIVRVGAELKHWRIIGLVDVMGLFGTIGWIAPATEFSLFF